MCTIESSRRRVLPVGLGLAVVVLLMPPASGFAQPYVYIANLGSDDISVIDVATGGLAATLPAGDDPNGVDVSPDGTRAYVTNFLSGTLTIIDTGSNSVVRTVPVGDGPVGVTIAPDGATAYVANRGADTLAVVDTSSGSVRSVIAVGDGPNGVAVTPDGRTAYVTNSFTKSPGTVSVVDLASGSVRDTVLVNRVPNRVAISPDGAEAYVTNFRTSTLSIIDTATTAVSDALRVSRKVSSVAVNPNGAYVYVTGLHDVNIVETATHRVTGSLPTGSDPRAIATERRGGIGYTANFWGDTVTVLDLADEEVVGDVPVGNRPFALAVNCVGGGCSAPPYTPKPTKTVTYTPTIPTPTATATVTVTETNSKTPTRTPTLRPGLEHVVIEIGGATAVRGERIPIEVTLRTGGQTVYGIAHEIAFTDAVGIAARRPGEPACALDAGTDATAHFAFTPRNCSTETGICTGLAVTIEARTPLLDGAVLYRCLVEIPPFTAIGTERLTNRTVAASGPRGEVLATRGRDGIITVGAAPTPSPGPTQPPEVFVQIGSVTGSAGQRVDLEVHLDTRGHAIAGIQNDIEFDPPLAVAGRGRQQPDCSVNPAIDKPGTVFAFQPPSCSGNQCTAVRAIVIALDNTDPIPDGALLYTCHIEIAPDAAPGTYQLRSSELGASTPDGDAVPMGAVGGSVTVLPTALQQQHSGVIGISAGRPCTFQQPCGSCRGGIYCPDGLCVGFEGVCDGGEDDGLLCDCPGGTCAAEPACGTDPQRGTCQGGARDGECCDRSFNCGGGAACTCTTLLCAGGPAKGQPCLDDHHCLGAACVGGNGHCNGGEFEGSSCVDDRDCPLGACVKPTGGSDPAGGPLPTSTPGRPTPIAHVSSSGCAIDTTRSDEPGWWFVIPLVFGLARGLRRSRVGPH